MASNPFDQFDNHSAVYGAPPKVEPYAAEDQALQREANARAEEANRRAAEANDRAAREFAATHNPDGSPKPAPKQVQSIPTAAAAGIQSNLENLRAVDAAIAALKARPQSIGPGTGMLGDTFTQFNDPQGTDTRALVGKIGATTIHDLSGAAVSATEAPRFQPFVPTVTDTPETAQKKLLKFREALQSQVKEALDYYGPANGYTPYQTPQSQQFLQSLTRQPNAPEAVPTAPKVGEFGGEQDPRLTELNPAQKAAYDAFWAANPNPTPEQLQQFGTSIHLNIANAKDIIAAKKAGRGLSSDIQAIPDISDVRGQGGAAETADAAIRGFVDVPTFGLSDKAAALGDTITNPGSTFQSNLARQYAISDYDAQNHPVARGLGQLGGAFAVPMGEINSLGQLSLKGAAVGAGYGAGSSRSLSDVPQNVLLNAAVGATAPVALSLVGRGGKAAVNALRGGPREVPPLVDPMTGELNQPMDAMRPADRVQAMRDYGMQTITPGMAGGRTARVLEQGFNNVPGSAGVMEDVNAAASGELRRSMQGVAQQFGSSKTLSEGGAELQRGAQERIARSQTVTSKAYNAIPISDQAQASTSATTATLQQLTGRFQSNPELADALSDSRLSRYLDAVQKGLSWKDLKDFRSIIGEKIGDMRFGEGQSTSDLRALYAGLSQDMQNTAASMGPRAVAAFNRANNLYRNEQKLIDGALTRILGPDGNLPAEQAAARVKSMTMGGKASGDLKTLAQIKAATVKSGAWDEIASTLIHLGGQPANSEGRAFNPQTFVQWYSDMAEPARSMLFKPELRKSLDGFVAMTQQLGRVKGMTNTSNTTPTMIGSGVIAAGGIAALSHPMALLGIAGGGVVNNLMARAWTSPTFVNLVTGYGRAVASGNANAVRSQVGRLSKLAATDPELRAPIESLLKNIANDNAVPSIAASSNANPDQNQQ